MSDPARVFIVASWDASERWEVIEAVCSSREAADAWMAGHLDTVDSADLEVTEHDVVDGWVPPPPPPSREELREASAVRPWRR